LLRGRSTPAIRAIHDPFSCLQEVASPLLAVICERYGRGSTQAFMAN
jgi:hypothetical protein